MNRTKILRTFPSTESDTAADPRLFFFTDVTFVYNVNVMIRECSPFELGSRRPSGSTLHDDEACETISFLNMGTD